jgi:hypothetical protein
MRYLKTFESFPGDNYELTINNKGIVSDSDGSVFDTNSQKISGSIIYDTDWEKELPEKLTINYHGANHSFKKGNIMLVDDLVEITYDSDPENPWGSPDTLEFDFYFVKDDATKNIRMDIDITYGDLMACEFSIEPPNKVNVIQHTSYNSKFDPSNTVFALEDESLDEFISFLNKFPRVKVTRHDLRFLDKYDNWKE